MNRIVETDDVMGGQPRIEGRRISVLQIYEWVNEEGMTPETVSSEFDVELADVHLALSYSRTTTTISTRWKTGGSVESHESRIAKTSNRRPSMHESRL